MSKQTEALKLALEAMQWDLGGEPLPTLEIAAVEAIKEALAEPEQKPVAWMNVYEDGHREFHNGKDNDSVSAFPVYISPPQREWVGLTDKELLQLFAEMDINAHAYEDDSLDFARAVEAELKEKNT